MVVTCWLPSIQGKWDFLHFLLNVSLTYFFDSLFIYLAQIPSQFFSNLYFQSFFIVDKFFKLLAIAVSQTKVPFIFSYEPFRVLLEPWPNSDTETIQVEASFHFAEK